MRKLKTVQALALAISLGLASSPSLALEGENWWIGGRLKQGFSAAYDVEDQGDKLGPSNYLFEIQGDYEISRNLTFVADFWLRGDLYPKIGGSIAQGGIPDYTSPAFLGQFGFRLNERGDGALPAPFGDNANKIEYLDDFNDEIIREISLKLEDSKNRFAVKIGKFQRGWGQSDGLRLLDVLHAQDLRERFVLRDADETRVPAWMVAVDLNLRELGVSGPFEALGLNRPTLEFIFTPEVHHSKFVINNPTPSNPKSGGIFGFPFPRLIDPVSGFGMPFLGANLFERSPDDFSFDDAEFGARLKFRSLGAEWTLNGFYGQQDLPVVKFAGANVLVGSALSDPSQAAAVIPLGVPAAVGAVQGPGGYMDYLRAAAIGAPIAFPLAPFGCADPLFVAPNCSVNINFVLDYDHRQKMVGGSFIRDMHELKLGPKNVAPVFRVETSYEFNKPFNRSSAPTPFGEQEFGTPVLALDPSVNITESDVWSTMVGFDYFLWVPFWENQRRSIFTSFQFFNIHTVEPDNLLAQAPYAFANVVENQKFATVLWSVDLIEDQLFLEGLTIVDIDNDGLVHRQRADFNFFGDTFRPRLEWMHFSGRPERGPAGYFQSSDFIEASITVQF